MTDSAANEIAADTPPMDYEQETALLRARQNFALAVPAGLAAAVVGAALWAAVAYASGMELGLIAIAVGALVGLAIRKVGNGVDLKFSLLGAFCAAFGWALGTILGDIAFLAQAAGGSYLSMAAALGVGGSVSLALEAADGMSLLFLAIAVFEGWKLSRQSI
jgi:hypothetical protein